MEKASKLSIISGIIAFVVVFLPDNLPCGLYFQMSVRVTLFVIFAVLCYIFEYLNKDTPDN